MQINHQSVVHNGNCTNETKSIDKELQSQVDELKTKEIELKDIKSQTKIAKQKAEIAKLKAEKAFLKSSMNKENSEQSDPTSSKISSLLSSTSHELLSSDGKTLSKSTTSQKEHRLTSSSAIDSTIKDLHDEIYKNGANNLHSTDTLLSSGSRIADILKQLQHEIEHRTQLEEELHRQKFGLKTIIQAKSDLDGDNNGNDGLDLLKKYFSGNVGVSRSHRFLNFIRMMNGSEEPLDYSDLHHDIIMAPKNFRVTQKHTDDQELSEDSGELEEGRSTVIQKVVHNHAQKGGRSVSRKSSVKEVS